ncbi:hypothetical protein K503DRAFT_774229 [Rhizopogon vinicolor AM-OR11-026]|uniref:DUF7079 domain-containing protein n=1 Tax=Rhizopogon vinicolor AM-OR11-026 TaxID=1314800 RepID=A0A1B7MQA2_9AGAM|nr:hypothetical protein K503DRAFT_774229 [Rhizopogon vinicolor AM-OR11-026]
MIWQDPQDGEKSISHLTSIADRIRTYKIDLNTAEHVFRYDLFPILWFTAMFMPFDKRRQRSEICQRLTAPYETFMWYCTSWYYKRLWETLIVEFGKEWPGRDEEAGHVLQATAADGSAICLQGATVVPVQESKKFKRRNKFT